MEYHKLSRFEQSAREIVLVGFHARQYFTPRNFPFFCNPQEKSLWLAFLLRAAFRMMSYHYFYFSKP
jgi:hypothetical protein